MRTFWQTQRQKLEQDAGLSFHRISDSIYIAWECRDEAGHTVASGRTLAECIHLAAVAIGEEV